MTTPLSEILDHPGRAHGIRFFVKRDDLIHPEISGNKWRKLHFLLEKLKIDSTPGILTFGGAFSNHLHAVAAAGRIFGFRTVGIVRGTAADLENPTLKFCREQGMNIFRLQKKEYDLKEKSPAVAEILEKYPTFFHLPEGGATDFAVRGCAEISKEILLEVEIYFDSPGLNKFRPPFFVAVPAGTGCTAAGVLAGLGSRGEVLIFPAAHGISEEVILKHLATAEISDPQNFRVLENRRFKKFAVVPSELLDFVKKFQEKTGILLDPIYNSKMFFQLFEMLDDGFFPEKSVVVAVHTGGLQGWGGRFGG